MTKEKRKREEEVRVSLPFIPLTSPEEEVRRDRERARAGERIGVIHVAHWLGTVFAGLMMAVGAVLLMFSIYVMMTGQVVVPLGVGLFFTSALAFLGVLNIISGLLLMGTG